ncbi:MAG: hypothetical protein Q9M40_07120 [Sulfurimonas sp.]|nr:hypothetical protein [Sulfurimonas sp.]MDQ7067745.1 hypothetical protein [Sulfurimonas sp.]
MIATEVTIVKATVSGGLGVLVATILGDVEMIVLFLTGAIASSLSYFHDWVHSHPRSSGLKMISEYLKYLFYGVALIFIMYPLCLNYCDKYVDLPITAWGFVAALSSGSAVVIVEWFATIVKRLTAKKAGI